MSYIAKPIYLMSPENSTMQGAINSFHNDWLPFHSYSKQLVLFHYTNLKGMRGILKTRSLWCTDTNLLNDPMELQYGKKLINNKLKEKMDNEKDEQIIELISDLINYVNIFDTVLYRVFIACFCEEDNLLSQWRAYSERGVGYNIGFNFNSNTKFSHEEANITSESYIILRKILYDFTKQHEIISKAINYIIDEAKIIKRNNTGGLPHDWPNQAALESINILFDIIMSLKNPVFKEEKEWRLIKVIDPDRLISLVKFKDVDEKLAPYLSTIIYEVVKGKNKFPISKIKFGPVQEEKITK